MHTQNLTTEQQLREEFRRINWWVRNERMHWWIVILCVLSFNGYVFWWGTIGGINQIPKELMGQELAIRMVVCMTAAPLISGALISLFHFFGEVPWRNYKKLYMPPEQEDEDDLSMSG